MQFITSDAKIPAYPMLIDSAGGTVDLSEANGQIGVLFNGVAAFRYLVSVATVP